MSAASINKRGINKSRLSWLIVALCVILAVVGITLITQLYEREKPIITILNDISYFGLNKEVSLSVVDEKRGVRSIEVVLVQEQKRHLLYDKVFPSVGQILRTGPSTVEETFTVDSRDMEFKDGAAELIVTVRDFAWWDRLAGNIATVKYPITIDTRPPLISLVHSPRYIRTGSGGVVVYRLNEMVEKHGVTINGFFHPGFPLPEKGDGMFGATIGIPYDLARFERVYVSAVDQADNVGKAPFGMILRQTRIEQDRINITDNFLALKIPELASHYPDLTGSPIEKFLYINSQVRAKNKQYVQDICRISHPERLWEGRFIRMARSSRTGGFPDRRIYYYQGEEIDRQTHLGIDLASVRHADVQAANHGIVVYAAYIGIYGKSVIMDHGQGIFSLYSHMSRIDAIVGDKLQRGDVIGLTGQSGMAGGDHLHLSIMINGIFVNPVEWWDQRWLEIHFLRFL